MNRCAHIAMRAWVGCLVLGSLACDDGLTVGQIDPDGGRAGDGSLDAPPEGEGDGDGASQDGGERETLEVSLLVEPAAASEEDPCGSNCANVTARVSEKIEGLSFRWSDSSLSGPGPHRVCTNEPPLTMNVEVESPALAGEFGSESRHGSASARVERSEYCACLNLAVEHPTNLFTMPEEGVDYEVCAGNPKPVMDPENDVFPMSMFMYLGDAFSIPLRRPVLSGEYVFVGAYLQHYIDLDVYGASSACASDLQPLPQFEGVAEQKFTHLVFKASGTPPEPVWPFPKQDWLKLRDVTISSRCVAPETFF